MKKIKIYSLLALMIITSSCSGFLDEYPDNAIDGDEAMNTLDDAAEVVVGVYSSFKNSSLYSGDLTLLPDLQADFVQAVQGYSNADGEIYRWDIQPNNSHVESVYSGLYLIISRCNFFMKYKDRVEATLKTDADKNTFNRRLGDAYFARALAYSELIKTYCEAYDPAKADKQLGVSLSLEYDASKDITIARSSLKESYSQVLEDLDKAEKLIDREAVLGYSAGRQYFTKGAVYALKARVYLYMQEWEKAIAYSSKVIDSGSYALCDATTKIANPNTGAATTSYLYMWQYDVGNEVIWAISMSYDDRGGALGKIFTNYNTSVYYPDYVPSQWVLDLYDMNDQRYSTFFREVTTGYSHGLTWPILLKYPGNPTIDQGGAYLFTNQPKPLRMSEQYLIRAEAYARLLLAGTEGNNLSLANKDLTTLRKKRILNYGAASASADDILQEIKDERVRELYMEGFRLSDLKRYGQGFERKKQNNTLTGVKNNQLKVTSDNVLFTWPIPKSEIEAGNGAIVGNASNK